MSLWFVAGMLAAVNPCGFVLLPTYLMYFLGIQSSDQRLAQRETLRKALKHLNRIVTMESVDALSDRLRDEFPEVPAPRPPVVVDGPAAGLLG